MNRVGELDRDAMECGDPETAWHETIKHFRWRAQCEAGIARDLRQTASAAKQDADEHSERAAGFLQLASAMERAPVTFAAHPLAEMVRLDEEMGLYDTDEKVPPAIAIEARSGETGTGSTEGESAGRKASPDTAHPSPQNTDGDSHG
jgi:hypothetical protein